MEKFKSFITEAKDEKYRVLVISGEPTKGGLFHTAKRFVDEAKAEGHEVYVAYPTCLLYTSPSPRDLSTSRMPSSA